MTVFIDAEDLVGQLVVIDVEAMINAGIDMKMEDMLREEFIQSVAAGVPASEAHSSIWRKRKGL